MSKKGYIQTEEHKKKISESNKLHFANVDRTGINNSFYGKKHTMESRKKQRMSHLGQVSGNKGKKHPELSNKLHPNWKGDDITYQGIHARVYRALGKAKQCRICKGVNSQDYDWANISGLYKKDINDFIELCASCHQHYDRNRRIFNIQIGNVI